VTKLSTVVAVIVVVEAGKARFGAVAQALRIVVVPADQSAFDSLPWGILERVAGEPW